MPKWMTVAFALFLSLQVFSTKGENVDDIINKYVQAMGGRERLNSIKTLYAEGIAEDGKGNKIPVTIRRVQDKLYKRYVSPGRGKKGRVITDSSNFDPGVTRFWFWEKEAIGNREPDFDCAGPLIDYNAKGYSAELVGKENINGRDCYKVKLMLRSGLIVHYYIDPENWYIIRESRQESGAGRINNTRQVLEITTDYSDYRKTKDGFIFPFREIKENFQTIINYQKIEVNKPGYYR